MLTRRAWLAVLSAGYLVLLALVALWPRHVDSGLGIVDWELTWQIAARLGMDAPALASAAESAANAVLFVPAGALVAWRFPRAPIGWAMSGFALSAAIETVQLLAPIDRTPSWNDVLMNGLGTAAGFALVRLAPRHRIARGVLFGLVGIVVLTVLGVLVWGLLTA